MTDSFTSPNPGDLYTTLSKADCPQSDEEAIEMAKKPYRQMTGGFNQLATTTRPETSVHSQALSRFNSNPGEKHWKAAMQLLRYLKGTTNMGLTFTAAIPIKLRGWVDASLGCRLDTGR